MLRFRTVLALLFLALPAQAQQLDITFRHVPSGVVENAFVPSNFNGWGQPYNSSGCIAPAGDAQMEFVRFENYWRKTVSLTVGSTYEYKIQVHRNIAGTSCEWLTDPLNPVSNPNDNNNSVVTVTDPMLFQLGEELTADGTVRYFSAGVFSSSPIDSIAYTVNGVTRGDGMDHFDADTGVFRYQLDQDVRSGAQFIIEAFDQAARSFSAEIGELQPPIDWLWPDFTTLESVATIPGVITRLDGSIDPALTGANALREGGGTTFVPVSNGEASFTATLEMGENVFRLEATVDGQTFTSDPITITRRMHPQDAYAVVPTVRGSSFDFVLDLQTTANLPASYEVSWTLDEALSTTSSSNWTASGLSATGSAAGPGELYFDVDVIADGETIDQLRMAAIVEDDGTVRAMDHAENAEWTKRAVVYEIFPLQFGPTATGSVTNPGNRLRQITDELDYIADMGFNTIWFMPIMRNLNGMTPLGAGYNIIDFKRVDQRLGSDDDMRALVERAHELGIRVILDITPSHVSPDHPWVTSLKQSGPFSDYLQTTPSAHNRGQDGRGANLSEIWQTYQGENLYRKYDGFGDLANLNWDNDDLQAEMLDVFAYWLDEFDVDGFRMDVWWGPTRRYGAERFAQPTREVIKRQRPDAWILGEIAGTGGGTEVYYADHDLGNGISGGLDAGYDWTFYWNGVRTTYGSLNTYDSRINNGGFWPGPNARYFRFLENHDEERVAKFGSAGEIKAMTGMLMTATGVPMVYAGQEVNYGGGSGDTRRTSVFWSTPNNGEMALVYQKLAQVRSQFPAFWTQDYDAIFVGRRFAGQPRVYAIVRPFLDQNAVVAINFDDTPSTLTIDPSDDVEMSHDGPIPYYNVFADTSASYLGEFEITLKPFETAVYITSDDPGFVLPDMPPLPFGAINTSAQSGAELPKQVELHAAYPNPFSASTRIGFELPDAGEVRVELFDMLGRRVAMPASGYFTAGRHEVTLGAAGLTSGTYIYRLATPAGTHSRTLVLIK